MILSLLHSEYITHTLLIHNGNEVTSVAVQYGAPVASLLGYIYIPQRYVWPSISFTGTEVAFSHITDVQLTHKAYNATILMSLIKNKYHIQTYIQI